MNIYFLFAPSRSTFVFQDPWNPWKYMQILLCVPSFKQFLKRICESLVYSQMTIIFINSISEQKTKHDFWRTYVTTELSVYFYTYMQWVWIYQIFQMLACTLSQPKNYVP